MKKYLMIAAAVAAVSATPAMAATYDVKANVAATCTALTGSTSDLDFGTLTVGADGKLTGSYSKNSSQANVMCNGSNTTITVTKTAMTNSATLTDTTNFTNTIDYTATVSLAGSPVTVDGSPHVVGELYGTLSITAGTLAPSGSKALLAGSYAGTVVVTLTPTA
ncbi:hypothetical protein OKA06_06055 [Novosphingobium sp. MW5]|nr:hypothetical protein [Novosphingobium sp. MW5]